MENLFSSVAKCAACVSLIGPLTGNSRTCLEPLNAISGRWQKRDMRGHDPPTFGKADPNLALSPVDLALWRIPFEFDVDTAKVATKGYNLQPLHNSRQTR